MQILHNHLNNPFKNYEFAVLAAIERKTWEKSMTQNCAEVKTFVSVLAFCPNGAILTVYFTI